MCSWSWNPCDPFSLKSLVARIRAPVVDHLAVLQRQRLAAPAAVGAVVPGHDLASFGDEHVVGVAVAGLHHAQRVGDELELAALGGQHRRGDLGLVDAQRAAGPVGDQLAVGALAVVVEREVGVGREVLDTELGQIDVRAEGVVERRQVDHEALARPVGAHVVAGDRGEVDLEDRARQRGVHEAHEVVGRRALVGVAPLGEEQDRVARLGIDREVHAVRGVVLGRSRQAADQRDAVHHGAGLLVEHELVELARVRVDVLERAAAAAADPVVRGGDVEHVALHAADRLLDHREAGDLAHADRPRRAVVVVVADLLDRVDLDRRRALLRRRLRLGDREPPVRALLDDVAPHRAVLLGDEEHRLARAREGERGGVERLLALEAGVAEADRGVLEVQGRHDVMSSARRPSGPRTLGSPAPSSGAVVGVAPRPREAADGRVVARLRFEPCADAT